MKRLLLAAAATLLAAAPALAEQLSPARVFESPDLNGPRARGVKLSPDGKSVTYIKVKADDLKITDLWIADVAGGEPRLLLDGRKLAPETRELSEAEKARRERAGAPPVASSTTPGMTRAGSFWRPSRATCLSTSLARVRSAS